MPGKLESFAALQKAGYELARSEDRDVRTIGVLIIGWVREGAPESLDARLGLRAPGGSSLRKLLANAERDSVLRVLMDSHDEWSGLDPGEVARKMRGAFDRYEGGRWKRERNAHDAPPQEPETSFWRVLRLGARMPKVEHLRRILAREPRDFHDPL